jgi:hypothetical protein
MVNSPTLCDAHRAQKADSAPNWLPGGVWGAGGVSEAVEGFVTTLPRMSGAHDDLRQPKKPGLLVTLGDKR